MPCSAAGEQAPDTVAERYLSYGGSNIEDVAIDDAENQEERDREQDDRSTAVHDVPYRGYEPRDEF